MSGYNKSGQASHGLATNELHRCHRIFKIGAVPKTVVRHETEAPPRELTRGVQYDLISIASWLTKSGNIQRQSWHLASMGVLDKTPVNGAACPMQACFPTEADHLCVVLELKSKSRHHQKYYGHAELCVLMSRGCRECRDQKPILFPCDSSLGYLQLTVRLHSARWNAQETQRMEGFPLPSRL